MEILRNMGYRDAENVMQRVPTALWIRYGSGGGGLLATHPNIEDRIAEIAKLQPSRGAFAEKEVGRQEKTRQEQIEASPAREAIDAQVIAVSLLRNPSSALLPVQFTGAAEQIRQILVRDLKVFGNFRVLDQVGNEPSESGGITLGSFLFEPWSKIGATGLIKGGVTVQGENVVVELRLFDIAQKSQIVEKRYTQKFQEWEHYCVAHLFADEVIFQYTGQRGRAPAC